MNDTAANPPALPCPVCDTAHQFTRPYLPQAALEPRKPVDAGIIERAVSQYFVWHPDYSTAWEIALWLDAKVSPDSANLTLYRRVRRALHRMAARGDLIRGWGEVMYPDEELRMGVLYRRRFNDEPRAARKA